MITEDMVFQIYGNLILTLAGFVLPIIAIALSLFPEGFKILKQKYEEQEEQTGGDILTTKLESRKTGKEINYSELNKIIHKLQLTQRKSRRSLSYLNPSSIVSKSIITIGISLVFFLLGISLLEAFSINGFSIMVILIIYGCFVISITFLILAMRILLNSIKIILEASIVVQDTKKISEEKTLKLLTALVDNAKSEDKTRFINKESVRIFFNSEEVIKDKKYTFSVNKEHKVEIQLRNLSDYMLKIIELGFVFPKEFLVKGGTSIYTDDKQKIIRFKNDYIQSGINLREGYINITFLEVGTFNIEAFVKAENLKSKSINFKIEVVE